MPPLDRHVFEVSSDGATQVAGGARTREPSRAIAPLRDAPPPAVEPPPPSLTAPEEAPQAAKPTRRRRVPRAQKVETPVSELKSAAEAPALPAAGKTRRTRKTSDDKPKPARKRKAAGTAASRKKSS
jgi:hypothetical protein